MFGNLNILRMEESKKAFLIMYGMQEQPSGSRGTRLHPNTQGAEANGSL